MNTSAPRRTVRWIALGILVVVVAVAAGMAVYVHSLLQPQRFTTMLARSLASAGLELKMDEPAKPALFPRPAVKLPAFSLTNAGSDIPVLKASGATIVVPWRALWHGDVAIARIDVDAPRIDLGELRATLARLPRQQGPPTLPTISAGVHMDHGTLTNNGNPLLFGLGVDTGPLAPGEEFHATVSGRTAAGRNVVARLGTVPAAPRDGAIEFTDVRFQLAAGDSGTALELGGKATWRGGNRLAMHLDGTFRHPAIAPAPAASAGSAASPASAASSSAPSRLVSDTLAIAIEPPTAQVPMQVSVKLDGPGTTVAMQLQPTQLGDWWQELVTTSPVQSPGPMPITGSADVRSLELGGVKATGLSIEAGPGVVPPAAASAASAASTAATVH